MFQPTRRLSFVFGLYAPMNEGIAMSARLRYHQPILDLLRVDPVLPFDRAAALEEREKVCGTRFPASVREWFAMRGAESLFHDNTNQDHLRKLAEIGDPAEARQGYLRVATENQSVVAWYVRLDAGDDPPVFHNNDEWNKDLSKTDWHPDSATFTNFIFDMISSHHFRGWYTGMHLSAKDMVPDEEALARLRGWFREGPTTDTPSAKAYRFFTTEGVIVARSLKAGDLAQGLAEWSVEAASRDALLDIGRKLWGLGTLSRTLEARSSSRKSRAKGEQVLQELRTGDT